MQRDSNATKPSPSRRGFLQTSATGGAALFAALGTNFAHAQGSDTIKVGLVGCGGRGTGAAGDVLNAAKNAKIDVKMEAIGDLFEDQAGRATKRFNVDKGKMFVGWDAYKQVIDSGVNYVMLATPPGFRPMMIKYAIDQGKNVFTEKPVAVDPVGVRMVMEASDKAKEKGLAIVAGTQRRHQKAYIETIKRIHDGAIGDILQMSIYWNQGGLWSKKQEPGWSDMEWQVRNWLYFTWLSGDHICEQHIHNIDVANWVLKSHPTAAYGSGGRQARTDPTLYGHIYDHFGIEYEYPNGARVLSQCRQIDGTDSRVGEACIGTKGSGFPGGTLRGPQGEIFKYKGDDDLSPYVQEHIDNLTNIKAGQPLNEGRQVAESTMAAIMGRISAYTGKRVTWEQAMKSNLSLMPAKLEFGDMPVPPVAMPGREKWPV